MLSSGSALLNTLGLQAPILMLIALYGTQVGGFLYLAQRVAALPITLLARSVGQVYFAEAARLTREDPPQLRSLFLRTTISLGRNHEIKEGDVLQVYRLTPTPTYLGTLKVLRADIIESVGSFTPASRRSSA